MTANVPAELTFEVGDKWWRVTVGYICGDCGALIGCDAEQRHAEWHASFRPSDAEWVAKCAALHSQHVADGWWENPEGVWWPPNMARTNENSRPVDNPAASRNVMATDTPSALREKTK